MKTSIYFIFLLLMYLFLTTSSCVPEGTGNKSIRIYRIENGTQHEIKMNFYNGLGFSKDVHIVGEGVLHEGKSDNSMRTRHSISLALPGDSVEVFFDKQKVQSYNHGLILTASPPTDKNIFSEDSYEAINNELYVFTFTEEDYKNAIPCNGDCE